MMVVVALIVFMAFQFWLLTTEWWAINVEGRFEAWLDRWFGPHALGLLTLAMFVIGACLSVLFFVEDMRRALGR